jgi:integrase/recombinase XerD
MPANTPTKTAAGTPSPKSPDSLRVLLDSFRRSLLAENKAPRTTKTYTEAVGLFEDFLASKGMHTDLHAIHREHVEAFIADLLAKGQKPATAHTRHRSLRVFFAWALSEGEIKQSPMQNISNDPDDPRALYTGEQGRAK